MLVTLHGCGLPLREMNFLDSGLRTRSACAGPSASDVLRRQTHPSATGIVKATEQYAKLKPWFGG